MSTTTPARPTVRPGAGPQSWTASAPPWAPSTPDTPHRALRDDPRRRHTWHRTGRPHRRRRRPRRGAHGARDQRATPRSPCSILRPADRYRPVAGGLPHPRRRHGRRRHADRRRSLPALHHSRSAPSSSPWSTAWPRSTRTRPPSRTAMPDWSGRPSTPRSSASTPSHPHRRCQRGRRARGRYRAARPRPRLPDADPPGPHLPHARRPPRDPQQPDARRRGDAWDRNDNLFGWTALLGDRQGGDDVSIYAAPARATDLSGLPRSYVDVGTVESFRDEAITYAQRLAQAGVNVDLHLWGGGFHGFDLMAPHAAISRASQAAQGRVSPASSRGMTRAAG